MIFGESPATASSIDPAPGLQPASADAFQEDGLPVDGASGDGSAGDGLAADGGAADAESAGRQAASAGDALDADVARLAELSADLDAVDAALVRLDNGTFDVCEVCRRPIGQDRLVADPLLTRCSEHI